MVSKINNIIAQKSHHILRVRHVKERFTKVKLHDSKHTRWYQEQQTRETSLPPLAQGGVLEKKRRS